MGRLIYMSMCTCLLRSQVSCISCSNNRQNRLKCSSRPRKMEDLSSFHFKSDLFGACGSMTSFVLFFVGAGQRSDISLAVLNGAPFQVHKTWWLLGGTVGLCSRWESSCHFDFPILWHQPKERRELLQGKAAELRGCWIKDWRKDQLGQSDSALDLHTLFEGIE